MVTGSPHASTAWAWWQHLRSGGSTAWAEWVRTAPDRASAATPPEGWAVPSAAALELVRRSAQLAHEPGRSEGSSGQHPPPPGLGALADLVAVRPGPGRGLAPQPLRWPGDEDRAAVARIGARPVDPADVPEEELLRLGVGVLSDLLLRAPEDKPRRRPVLPSLRRGPSYVLDGAPVTTAAVRRALAAAGYVEGGPSPRVVLLALPLDRALAEVWSARVQHGSAVRWQGLAARWPGRDALPPRADLPRRVRRWTAQGAAVHVVTVPPRAPEAPDAHDVTRAAEAVAGLLGPRGGRARRPSVDGSVRELAPAAVDAVRRVNAVLGVRVEPERHRAATRRLVASLPASAGPLTVPEQWQGWVHDRAVATAQELASGRYPVLGRPEDVLPRPAGAPTRPARADVLAIVLRACLDHAKEL